MVLALGRSRSAKGGQGATNRVDDTPAFLAAANLKPFVDKEITLSTRPIRLFNAGVAGNYGVDDAGTAADARLRDALLRAVEARVEEETARIVAICDAKAERWRKDGEWYAKMPDGLGLAMNARERVVACESIKQAAAIRGAKE